MSRLEQLVRYVSNVFHVTELVKGVSDSRDKSRIRIATSTVLLAWMMGFFARIGSREEMGRLLDRRTVQKLVGGHVSSDTLGRVLGQIDSDSLRRAVLVPVVREIRRNKAWRVGSAYSPVLVAIDGSDAFHTHKQPCPDCSTRQCPIKGNGEAAYVTDYFHHAVWAFIIGTEPQIYLDVEPIAAGEGETTAAARLLIRLAKQYGRWIDAIVADHAFAHATFLNQVREVGFHYIVRVKDEERRYLTRDAAESCAQRRADHIWVERYGHKNLQVVAWDKEGFTSWKGLAEPARVVICDETELAQATNRRCKVPDLERKRPRAFFATSYPKADFPTHEVWLTYHKRWHIENNGFRQFKHEWHWDHPFVHTSTSLLNLWLLMAIAVNLFVMFTGRRLLTTRKGAIPMRTVAQEIAANLRTLILNETPCWNSA